MDKLVIPMVNYFNAHGLKTCMSCQGHNRTNMSMFWISFDKSVTEQDIINFQMKHLQPSFKKDYPSGGFYSNGRFAERLFVNAKNIPFKQWYYFAATIEAANSDLNNWRQNEIYR